MSLSTRPYLFLALLFTSAFVVACAPRGPAEVPEELLGVWITDDPRYEDRFLKLEKRKIHFGMGGNEATEAPIIGLEELSERGALVYRIKYLSPDGLEYTQSLYYDRSTGELRYKNRPSVVWRRVEIEIKPEESAQSSMLTGNLELAASSGPGWGAGRDSSSEDGASSEAP